MRGAALRRGGDDYQLIRVLARTDTQLGLLLVVACLLGGGGVGDGVKNLAVQLLAIVLLAVNGGAVRRFFTIAPRPLVVLVCLTMALPLVQLLPLSAGLWRNLPGRDLVAGSLDLIGEGDSMFPISVAPARTALAFVGLVAPFVVLVLTYGLDARGGDRQRKKMLVAVVAIGLLNVVIGAYQMTQVEQLGADYISGSFANKNTTGLFLDIAILALFGFSALRAKTANRQVVAYGFGALLFLGVILSFSRSATALLLVVLATSVLLMRERIASGSGRLKGQLMRPVMVAAAVVLAIGVLGHMNERVGTALGRFQVVDTTRLAIWTDAGSTLSRFWPIGSGMGTFDEVAQVDESLENVPGGRAGRVHNDFLEVAIEAGIAGVVLLVGWIGYFGYLAVTTGEREGGAIRATALAVLLCIALQSFVDYPLRNQAMLCVAALFVGLLRPSRRAGDPGDMPVGETTHDNGEGARDA